MVKKKGLVLLGCLLTVCLVGCSGGSKGTKDKKVDTDRLVDISIGDWLNEDRLVELCRVSGVPSQASVLYANGYRVDRVSRDNPVIITGEKDKSVSDVDTDDYIWLSLEYDVDKGDIGRVSYGVSDSWSKIRDDDEFTEYSDTVVYDVDEADRVNVYMCLDEESDKSLGISASFNTSKLNDKEKVEMLLDSVDVIGEDRREFEPVKDMGESFTDKIKGSAEGTETLEEKEDAEGTEDSGRKMEESKFKDKAE